MATHTFTHEAPDEALEIALEALSSGDEETTRVALEYALHDLNMNYQDALESQLMRLMMHIVKWQIQPERRSGSWAGSIANARYEIARIQRRKPSLNKRFLEEIWNDCLQDALRQAQAETGIKPAIEALSWQEVFAEEFIVQRR